MITGKPHSFLATIGIAAIVVLSGCSNPIPEEQLDAEAIIVGAGISGLSAAVEMGRAGVDVLVIDMNSVPGGHAVMAGGVAVVGGSSGVSTSTVVDLPAPFGPRKP